MSEYRNVAEPLAAATRPENKCQHDVHSPNKSFTRNRYCSLCRSAMPELFVPPKPGKRVQKKKQKEIEVAEPEDDLRTESIEEVVVCQRREY